MDEDHLALHHPFIGELSGSDARNSNQKDESDTELGPLPTTYRAERGFQ